ncbi:MAG TPA: nucleoside hydrolase, partial [Candidatus Glassbacteria bacterium]|nr:nucleoside hydrolase [Candidatus Glassbacteria bacterium]
MARISALPGGLTLILSIIFLVLTFIGLIAEADAGGRERLKIIIDTDIGEDIDDILVTAFALNSPEFEVLAITVVDGD